MASWAVSFPSSLALRMLLRTPIKSKNYDLDTTKLATVLRLDSEALREWLEGVPAGFSYRSFLIKKESGRNRTIEAPNRRLKELQRTIYSKLLKGAAVQTAANGFVPGRSLIDNVAPHTNSKVVIKIDLKDFFTETPTEKVTKFWRADGWDEDAATILSNICCKDGYLPQGAPTSPALSNLVNRGFDGQILRIANKYNARYTRYADDLTFSFPRSSESAFRKIRPMLEELRKEIEEAGYRIQLQKGIKILRRHQRQVITGLVVNDEIRLPKTMRHRIRGLRHLRDAQKLSDTALAKLEGYERLEQMVERARNPVISPKRTKAKERYTVNIHGDYIKGDKVQGNKVGGDVVSGDKNTAGSSIGGIQTLESAAGEARQTVVGANQPKSRSERRVAVIGIIIAALLALAAIVASVTVPEIRQLFGLKNESTNSGPAGSK